MKHLFYAFYVSFYAGAMFVAGLFFGQFMERRWAAREGAEAAAAPQEHHVLEETPTALPANSNLPTR